MRLTFLTALSLLSFSGFAQDFYLFIGTYTSKGSKGIYVYRFNTATGQAEWVSNTDSASNPSYLALSASGKFVYAVKETGDKGGGQLTAYSFDKKSGKLSFINQQQSGGANPCYVAVTKDNKWAAVGNYTGGSLSVLPINKDGSLQPAAQTIQHQGSSANKNRQEKAHVHATVFSPQEDFLFTPDLGTDKINVYKFRSEDKQPLQPAQPAFAASEPGSGPRHFTFHPNKKFAYLIEELSGTVVAHQYSKGVLKPMQRITTHPQDYKGAIGSADIHLSPDGRFLYASNRGDANTITIFSVDEKTGKLSLKGYQSTLGNTPRNFIIDPTGKFLLVANQQTGNVVIFKRNAATGLLQPTGKQIEVSMPVCLKMMKM